jgi:uncharacterized glyoxalase superfamily protein PhnB
MSQKIYPTFRYRDANAAIEFLKSAFGFEEKSVHRGDGERVQHAELAYDGAVIMLGSARPAEDGDQWPLAPGAGGAYVVVADPDAHHERARAAGAEILMALTDQPYGSREYTARDPEGVLWSFGTYDPSASGG